MSRTPILHARAPLALAVTLALSAWSPVHAEETTDPAATTRGGTPTQLEQVVITAERRVANIKDVPTAVSTVSGDKLDALNASGEDVRMLSGRVPSLNIESSFGRAFPRFYIRGYGNTDFHLNASQPVSLVYDDVVQENPILKGFPVFDVKAVEVIAGPQGTLFGRNTPAGVVKFDSVAPSHKSDGYFNIGIGSLGTVNVEAAGNVSLGSEWAMRISGQDQHRDNWVHNTVPNAATPSTEGYDDRAVRVQALYTPSKDFSALFNIHNRELDGSPRLFRASIIKPGTNDLVDGFDPAKMSIDGTNVQRLHATGASARLKWSLDGVDLHSITAIETVQPFSRGDVDGGATYNLSPFVPPPYKTQGNALFPDETSDALQGHRQLTQEFRLESTTAGPLSWQAGLFVFDEHYTWIATDYTAVGGGTRSSDTYQSNQAYAVFGSASYQLNPALKLGAGLRYTQDKKSLSTTTPDGMQLVTTTGLAASTNDSKWTWDTSATYAVDKSTNLYARIGTGFRASAILPASEFGPLSMAGPETLTSYEAGVKSDFWNRRARLSASVFHYDVSNLQLTEVGGSGNANTVKSANKVAGQGVELNLDLLPMENMTVSLSGSYNDTKIHDASLTVAGCGSGCTMLNRPAGNGEFYVDGNSLPNAPRWVGNLNVRYAIPTPGGNEFYVYTDWTYRSEVSFFLYNSVEFTGKALTEGGLRGGYIWDNGKYEVAAYVRNLTNTIRVTGGIDFNNLTGFINDPRTYGVQFKASF